MKCTEGSRRDSAMLRKAVPLPLFTPCALPATRLRDDSEPEYQAQIRRDHWEVVVPELVFGPMNQS